jgi:hypothetical protein
MHVCVGKIKTIIIMITTRTIINNSSNNKYMYMNIYRERERLGGAVDCLCVPQPPYLELHLKAQDLYLKYQEPYLKYQQLFYMISSVS